MTLFRLTKRQIITRLILTGILLLGGSVYLFARACPQWHAADVTPEIGKASENPYLNPDGQTQETRILPPEGYARVPAGESSFLSFMRQQPVYEDGSMLISYAGQNLSNANAAAVYTLSLGDEGYQQCADTIIRLWSEYFYASGQTERIAFAYSNGYPTDYESWRSGYRYVTAGNLTARFRLAGYDDSEQAFHNYLKSVMRYAGTLSLEAESTPIAAEDAHAGDMLCHGGAPGHAAVIVDEAVNADGERCFLLAQGFIPAQTAHIIKGYGDTQNPWYSETQLAEHPVRLCSYTFDGNALRRWKDGFGEK